MQHFMLYRRETITQAVARCDCKIEVEGVLEGVKMPLKWRNPDQVSIQRLC